MTTANSITNHSTTAMLARLIKYDLKYIWKGIAVFGTILLVSVVIFNLTCTTYDPNDPTIITTPTIVQLLHTIAYNAIYTCFIAMAFNCAARVLHRYGSNFYNDEAYLTHTLPLTRPALWLSKFCGIALSILSVIAVLAVCGLGLCLTTEGQQFITGMGIMPDAPASYVLAYIVTIFMQILFATLCGVTGITLGNRSNNHRHGKSLLLGFAFYAAGAVISAGVIALWIYLSPNNQLLFNMPVASDINESGFISTLLLCASLAYATFTAILYSINHFSLKRGIDIE